MHVLFLWIVEELLMKDERIDECKNHKMNWELWNECIVIVDIKNYNQASIEVLWELHSRYWLTLFDFDDVN